jgi:cytochrome oxidase Cu insertion factor (SCO1/SenC/PrrC family)
MKLKAFLTLATTATLAAASAVAHDGQSHDEHAQALKATKVTMSSEAEMKARNYFTDFPVITQDGQELPFFSGVLKDRVVLLSLFFTNCKQACPLTTQRLAEVQDRLGDDLGSRIFLISISLDPDHDTPEVVKNYAAKFQPKKGWLFITGEKKHLQQITYRLGHTTEQIDMHNTHYMIGNVNIERWSKLAPNLPPEAIVLRLRQMAEHSAAN